MTASPPTSDPCWAAGSRRACASRCARRARSASPSRSRSCSSRCSARINAGQKVATPAADVPFTQYYTPAIGVFGAHARVLHEPDRRRRHRARDGPAQARARHAAAAAVYLGAWLTGATLIGIASVVLLFVVAVPALGVDVYARAPGAI